MYMYVSEDYVTHCESLTSDSRGGEAAVLAKESCLAILAAIARPKQIGRDVPVLVLSLLHDSCDLQQEPADWTVRTCERPEAEAGYGGRQKVKVHYVD